MGRPKTKFTIREIRELQCKKCTNKICECRNCKGEMNKCFCRDAGEPCSWDSYDPICKGFSTAEWVW